MAVFKSQYGTETAITMTSLNGLTNNSSAQSAGFANTTELAPNAFLNVEILSATTGTGATGYALVYLATRSGGSGNYDGGATGSDTGYTEAMESSMVFLGQMDININNKTFRKKFPIGAIFGGMMPPEAAVVIKNVSGATLPASGHAVELTNYFIQSI